jgi:hypothetical protein
VQQVHYILAGLQRAHGHGLLIERIRDLPAVEHDTISEQPPVVPIQVHEPGVPVVVPHQVPLWSFDQGIHVVRVPVCPGHGDQYFRLRIDLPGVVRISNQREGGHEHEGKTQ